MRFITTINNKKCLEWEISGTQGALMALLYEANAWAKEIIVDNKVYYFVSKNLILRELPLYYEKVDTVYRHLKVLAQKGIIEYIKQDKKDLIRITEKGKEWNFLKSEKSSEINPSKIKNSEINPTKLGNKSEKSSEINPTNKDTILNQDTNISSKKINKKEKVEIESVYKSKEFKKAFYDFVDMRYEIKKIPTKIAIKMIIKKLEKVGNEELAIQMLERSIVNNWQDVYEIQERGNDGSKNYKSNSTGKREVITRDYYAGTEDWNK